MTTKTFRIEIPVLEHHVYFVQAVDRVDAWAAYEKRVEAGSEADKYYAGEQNGEANIIDVTQERTT